MTITLFHLKTCESYAPFHGFKISLETPVCTMPTHRQKAFYTDIFVTEFHDITNNIPRYLSSLKNHASIGNEFSSYINIILNY